MDSMYSATVRFTMVWDTWKSRDISDREAARLVSEIYLGVFDWA